MATQMIDVKPTMLARTFEDVWLSATFAHYRVDKTYYALEFSKKMTLVMRFINFPLLPNI